MRSRHARFVLFAVVLTALAAPAIAGDAIAERIDLNTANMDQLMELPRIGPKVAARIITYREQNGGFRLLEELLDVRGIGPRTYEAIRERVTVEPPEQPPDEVTADAEEEDPGHEG